MGRLLCTTWAVIACDQRRNINTPGVVAGTSPSQSSGRCCTWRDRTMAAYLRRRRVTRRRSTNPGRIRGIPVLEVLEARTLLDASGPRILGHTAEVQSGAFVSLNVIFNEPINPESFSTED